MNRKSALIEYGSLIVPINGEDPVVISLETIYRVAEDETDERFEKAIRELMKTLELGFEARAKQSERQELLNEKTTD